MSNRDSDNEEQSSDQVHSSGQLQSLIAKFLDAENRRETVDREALIQQHAEYKDSLYAFFANHDQMKRSKETEGDGVTLPPRNTTHDEATLLPRPHQVEYSTLSQNAGSLVPSKPAEVGDKIRYFGDYELLEEIARGGMGVVYKARQINLNRIVALKMILAGQLASEEDVKRFYTEAEAAANLDHPCIVPIYEVGQHQGQHYFSMGFIDGESLAARVASGPLPPKEAAELLVHIAEAIQYAHDHDVIHRDLKPANILLDKNGQPRVTDFGLAKQMKSDSNLTGTGQILGTPSYMAPEQAGGKVNEVGPLADVYALGAILYCLMTGRPPFQAANPLDTLMQVLDKEPIPPRQLNPTLPMDLETICLKCLNKEPLQRYASAQHLVDELARFLDGRPIIARPTNWFEHAKKWAKRHPAVTSLSTAVAASVLIGLIAVTWQWRVAVAAWNAADSARIEAATARGEAERERDATVIAQEMTQETLARSLLEQARAVRLARQSGHRWRSLELLQQAEALRSHHRSASRPVTESMVDATNNILPSRADLRIEALASLQLNDGRKQNQWNGIHNVVSPDGRYACIIDTLPKFRITLFDIAQHQEVRHWEDPAMLGANYCLSPDARMLAVHQRQGLIQLWNLADSKRGRVLEWPASETRSEKDMADALRNPGRIQKLEFSSDGHNLTGYMFGPGNCQLAIWDIEKEGAGQILTEAKLLGSSAMSFHLDGRRLGFVSAPQQITIWDIEKNKFDEDISLSGRTIGPIAFSPDGKLLAWADIDEKANGSSIVVRDLELGLEKWTINTSGRVWVSPIAFSPDAARLAVATQDGTIFIYRLDTGTEEFRLEHGGSPQTLHWNADGRTLISGGMGSMKQWEIELASPVHSVHLKRHPQSVISRFAVNPDGQSIIVATTRGALNVHDIHSGEIESVIARKTPEASTLQFSSNGKLVLLTGRNDSEVYDLEQNQSIAVLKADKLSVQNAAFGPDGSPLVCGIASSQPQVLKVTDGSVFWEGATPLARTSIYVRLSPDGRLLSHWEIGSTYSPHDTPGDIEIRELTTQRVVSALPALKFSSLGSFSQRGKWLTGIKSGGSYAQLADSMRQPETGPKRSFVASDERGTVRVWDVKRGKVHADVRGGQVESLAFSSDERLMAILYRGGAIDVWILEPNELLLRWNLAEEPGHLNTLTSQHMEFTPDGRYLVVLSGVNSQIQMLDLVDLQERLTPMGLGLE